MKTKHIMIILLIFVSMLILWLAMVISDYINVMVSFNKPLFAQAVITADDGGSGTYRGLGYTIIIEGNFMPEDMVKGVYYAEFHLFGARINSISREEMFLISKIY